MLHPGIWPHSFHIKTLHILLPTINTLGALSVLGIDFCLEYFHTSKNKFKNAMGGISKGRAKISLFGEKKRIKGYSDYLYTWLGSKRSQKEKTRRVNNVNCRRENLLSQGVRSFLGLGKMAERWWSQERKQRWRRLVQCSVGEEEPGSMGRSSHCWTHRWWGQPPSFLSSGVWW